MFGMFMLFWLVILFFQFDFLSVFLVCYCFQLLSWSCRIASINSKSECFMFDISRLNKVSKLGLVVQLCGKFVEIAIIGKFRESDWSKESFLSTLDRCCLNSVSTITSLVFSFFATKFYFIFLVKVKIISLRLQIETQRILRDSNK